jgi:hypothetical protein
MTAFMIARRDGTLYAVRLSVARRGGWHAWGAVSGGFERGLAAQESEAVTDPHVESESRRGRDYCPDHVVDGGCGLRRGPGADYRVVGVPEGRG